MLIKAIREIHNDIKEAWPLIAAICSLIFLSAWITLIIVFKVADNHDHSLQIILCGGFFISLLHTMGALLAVCIMKRIKRLEQQAK